MTGFQPFAEGGRASWSRDRKTISGSLAVRADLKIKLVGAEVVDGVFLVTTFEIEDGSPLHDPEVREL